MLLSPNVNGFMLLPRGLDVSGEFARNLPSNYSDGADSSLQQAEG